MHMLYAHTMIIIHILTHKHPKKLLQLISAAYPDRSLLPIPPLAHAITGEQVQLKCAIPPGQLIQQYSVTWDRSERIIDTTNDDRYSVNASDLSLIINNVRLSDTSDEYHCVFTVRDPNGMDSRSYETMQDRDIPLVILGERIVIKIVGSGSCAIS